LHAYAQVGADCLYAPGIDTREQIEAVVATVSPKPVNLPIGGPSAFTIDELTVLGVRRVSVGSSLARARPLRRIAQRAVGHLVEPHVSERGVSSSSTTGHFWIKQIMSREIIRVEPLSSWLERWKAPTSAVTRHGDTLYVSGFPPFDPDTGEIMNAPIELQTERVLEQLKLCVETAGSSLDQVLKCNVYCTSVDMFPAVNAIYARFFGPHPPARIFVNVPAWPGHFDIEIDCVAAIASGAAAVLGR
jgi:2-iminobutanoate/2-iminopropanoate deaminase